MTGVLGHYAWDSTPYCLGWAKVHIYSSSGPRPKNFVLHYCYKKALLFIAVFLYHSNFILLLIFLLHIITLLFCVVSFYDRSSRTLCLGLYAILSGMG